MKTVYSLCAMLLCCSALNAGTIYTYTGNPLAPTSLPAGITSSNFISVTIELASPVGPNHELVFFTPAEVLSFSISDQKDTYTTFASNGNLLIGAGFSTDAAGMPLEWYAEYNAGGYQFFGDNLVTVNQPWRSAVYDGVVNQNQWAAYNSNNPGTWTITDSGTPEPGTVLLLCSGLGAMFWRKNRLALP